MLPLLSITILLVSNPNVGSLVLKTIFVGTIVEEIAPVATEVICAPEAPIKLPSPPTKLISPKEEPVVTVVPGFTLDE